MKKDFWPAELSNMLMKKIFDPQNSPIGCWKRFLTLRTLWSAAEKDSWLSEHSARLLKEDLWPSKLFDRLLKKIYDPQSTLICCWKKIYDPQNFPIICWKWFVPPKTFWSASEKDLWPSKLSVRLLKKDFLPLKFSVRLLKKIGSVIDRVKMARKAVGWVGSIHHFVANTDFVSPTHPTAVKLPLCLDWSTRKRL